MGRPHRKGVFRGVGAAATVPQVRCPRCSTTVNYADGFSPICPSCGFAGSGSPPAAVATPSSAPQPTAAKPPNLGLAIAALVVNVVVWPGLGTMIGGRIGLGLGQGFLMLGGLIMTITIILMPIGIPAMIGAWVWALVTGIQMVQAAQAPAANPAPA